MNYDKANEIIQKFAAQKGHSEAEIRKSFEEILDKFMADGEKGKQALKFLGFDDRPGVDEFISAIASKPEILKGLKGKI